MSVMVFSYFYIWTAAAAWFACVALLWVLFRRDQFRRLALAIVVVGTFAIASVAVIVVETAVPARAAAVEMVVARPAGAA